MSEEFVSGCIQHRDMRHLRLYYDYMDIYSDNEYKAKIIRILETWTDHKRAEWYKANSDRLEQGQPVVEPDFWITMSYQQFRQYMRHTASEDTLKKALVELEQAKHIKRRVNPDFPYGPPQYLLNSRVIQAALNKLSTPPQVPELPPQEDTPPPGKTIPPQEITPTQGVKLPLPRGVKTGEGGRKNTPTLGGKFGTSNITTKNYLEDVIDSDKEESEGEQSDTTTLAPNESEGAAPSPQSDTFALPDGDYIIIERLSGGGQKIRRASGKPIGELIPIGMDTSEGLQNLVTVDAVLSLSENETQSQSFPLANSNTPLEGGRDALVATDTLPDANPARSALDRVRQAVGEVSDGKEQEIDEEWCNAETEHHLPAIPKPAPPSPGGTSHEQNRDATSGNVTVEGDSGCTAPASAPQVPPGVTPPRTMRATVVPAPPKWDAQAMVARAEALREKPFSENARPKETRSARKLFARKPDLTEEEFTGAFQHWNTPWWRETNGLFCITDLAAVPKNKSEMRLIIALEKLAIPKKPPGGQVIQMPTSRGQQWRSSFDDPNYDMSSEFYPGTVAR
jgi:hypothetical protein